MSEIGHLNLYCTKKDYAYMSKVKQKVAKDTGKKTWLEVILFLCEQYDNQERDLNTSK